jgi:hypothetical protein
MKQMTAQELDVAAARLEQIELEDEKLRSALREQVQAFGFSPPRSEKSKRLLGNLYQLTASCGLTTEVKDSEVERIRGVCPGVLFDRLFKTVTKFKLTNGAMQVLAGRLPADAPRNLRLMFSRAVETKESSPRLRIEKVGVECSTRTAAS